MAIGSELAFSRAANEVGAIGGAKPGWQGSWKPCRTRGIDIQCAEFHYTCVGLAKMDLYKPPDKVGR